MDENTRKKCQEAYIRVCRDSGWKMDYIDAAIFTGKLIDIHPLILWGAFSGFDQMDRIAKGEHPVCKKA